MVCTGNMRAWRNVVEMRTEHHAEEEIRRLSAVIAETLMTKAPVHMRDYVVSEVRGWPEYTTRYRKI
jgi:thymidylate synthase ThyX